MSRIVLPSTLAFLLLAATPGAGALVGEIGFCPVWEEDVAIVCVSEYGFTNSPDGECSGPGEYFFGTNSAFVSALGGVVLASFDAWSACGSSDDGSARSSSEAVSAHAAAAGQSVAAGWWAFSEDDGSGSASSDCQEWASANVATEALVASRPCDGGHPPLSPPWGMLIP